MSSKGSVPVIKRFRGDGREFHSLHASILNSSMMFSILKGPKLTNNEVIVCVSRDQHDLRTLHSILQQSFT